LKKISEKMSLTIIHSSAILCVEVKNMRISKPPEERKQEIIDTAMQIFAEKGYEATSVTDIAKRMGVASGLFYKYFPSKEELYHLALQQYARQFSGPVIDAIQKEYKTMEEIYTMVRGSFITNEPSQQYHSFFHGKGNELFHQQLNDTIAKQILPYAIAFLEKLVSQFELQVPSIKCTSEFLVYGIMPITNDEECKDKGEVVLEIFRRVLQQ
jgi:AcrR family transcriptional regulator